ncbi:5776_t:CDS:2, partial [Dentiscutata erythropus]
VLADSASSSFSPVRFRRFWRALANSVSSTFSPVRFCRFWQ